MKYNLLLLQVFSCILLTACYVTERKKKNSDIPMVIVEVDPGIDDVIAAMNLFGAHRLKKVKVIAIACSNGNIGLMQACKNTKLALDAAGIDENEIPLFYGVDDAIYQEVSKDLYFLQDGLGNIQPPLVPKKRISYTAVQYVEYLQQQTIKYPRRVTIMSLGSLTLTALALLQQPDLNLKDIWIMGGNNVGVSRVEWNIKVDPEAAHYVLRQSDRYNITMVTYQDCRLVKPTIGWRNETLGTIPSDIVKLLNKAEAFRIAEKPHNDIWYQYDPVLSVAFIDQSSIVEKIQANIKICLDCGELRGIVLAGNHTVNLIKGLHLNKYQNSLIETAKALPQTSNKWKISS